MKIDSNSPVSSPMENKPLLQDVESVSKEKFEDVLATETQDAKSPAEESFKKAPDIPSSTPNSAARKSEASTHYGLGQGPGYGSCVGTAGYGGDSCPDEPLNTISRTDAGAEELKLCQGSGYATGVTFPGGLGTSGYGGDTCPDDLKNVIR
ncbi:MAG: hypothetical protein ACLGPL_12390, partial [Acidobacteriota bacterium]